MDVERCPRTGHEGNKLRRRGRVLRDGVEVGVRVECVDDNGDRHYFTARPAQVATGRPVTHGISCPNRSHHGHRVRKVGTRTKDGVTWQRLRCVSPDGEGHSFSVVSDEADNIVASLTAPPGCPEHPGSTVRRAGTYGSSVAARQRYSCDPTGGARHYFTPPLPREQVQVGTATCGTCYDLLTPHQGEMSSARRSPWSLRSVVASLNDLSLGASYASVSLDLRRRGREMDEHLSSAQGQVTLADGPQTRSGSATARDAKGAWHLAADLVEQYSPLLFSHVTSHVRERERRRRRANDAALRRNPQARLAQPIVYILDELPVVIHRRPATGSQVQASQYSLLVVVEVLWKASRGAAGPLPEREARLRLVRAYPRANEQAWRLVLDELRTRPDFVVADCADAITNAVRSQWGDRVGVIPSFFHIARNLRTSLSKLPGATETLDKRPVLVPDLSKHLDHLARDEVTHLSTKDWSRWWDDLLTLAAALPAPTVGLAAQRAVYEKRVAQALPLLRAHPHLPASNAAVETRIRLTLEPFLEGRGFRYRNLARTNFLLDLAVCRSQGLFTDPDLVARLIREHNVKNGGWALAPRTLADTQPPTPATSNPSADTATPAPERPAEEADPFASSPGADTAAGKSRGKRQPYSSLLNPFIVSALYASRVRP